MSSFFLLNYKLNDDLFEAIVIFYNELIYSNELRKYKEFSSNKN